MRLTALLPPPPMPITLIRAPVNGGSSSMKILMPLPGSRASGVIVSSSLTKREGFQGPFLLYCAARGMGIDMLRTISCAAGPKAYNKLSENTTETIFESGNKVCELGCLTAAIHHRAHLCCLCALRQ